MTYLNCAGIIYLLLHSIYIRRFLAKEAATLDENNFTPADYAVIARDLPKNMTKAQLKQKIESYNIDLEIKVVYINFCYKLTEMIKGTAELKDLYHQKGLFLIYQKEVMKDKNLLQEEIDMDPSLIPDFHVKTGLFSTKLITLAGIEEEITKVQDALIAFEDGLAPETKGNHFLGVAIIVFESSRNV